eukprot:Hpha_TRINITY_DN33467_c0_g1::TRINITY_DN33467_c0_g1_i1::g.757::m.757
MREGGGAAAAIVALFISPALSESDHRCVSAAMPNASSSAGGTVDDVCPSVLPSWACGNCGQNRTTAMKRCSPFLGTCRHNALKERCIREDVICRFNQVHGVFWVPGPLRPSPSGKPYTYSVNVTSCGRCTKNCETHLWARLSGKPGTPMEGMMVGTSSTTYHEVPGKRPQVVLEFTTTRPGDYLLEIEQRYWHGGAESVDARDFEFAARSLDLENHRNRLSGGRLDDWPALRLAWVLPRCLEIHGSPFPVRLEPLLPPGKGEQERDGKMPPCRLQDLAKPGYWAPQTAAENRSLGEMISEEITRRYPMRHTFHTPGCEWSLNPTQLKTCLSQVSEFVLAGDSLIRMKAEKMVKAFRINPNQIREKWKRRADSQWTPEKSDAMLAAAVLNGTSNQTGSRAKTSFKRVQVVIDDMGLVHHSWHGNWKAFQASIPIRAKQLREMVKLAGGGTVWIFYEAHYLQDYRCDGCTEPRTTQFNGIASKMYKDAGFAIHRTASQTGPLRENYFTGDGLHHQAPADTFMTYMLLSAACHEVAEKVRV